MFIGAKIGKNLHITKYLGDFLCGLRLQRIYVEFDLPARDESVAVIANRLLYVLCDSYKC